MNSSLKVTAGAEVIAEGRRYQISRVLDLESVLAHDVETGEAHQLPLIHLLPTLPLAHPRDTPAVERNPHHVSDADWQQAQARFAVIQPLVEQGHYSRTEVQARVDQIASNRRILGPNGKVRATRYTATKEAELRAEPEGTIDPVVSLVSFLRQL